MLADPRSKQARAQTLAARVERDEHESGTVRIDLSPRSVRRVLQKPRREGVTGNLSFRILGGLHRKVYRLTGGKVGARIANMPVLLLTTTGRRSGRPRTQPLTYTRAREGYVVIASKGGAAQHPLWYLNLRANPLAEVTVGRETRKVQAREADGDERERLWRQLADVYSGYDRYAQKTSRRIPVIVLEPVRSSDH